MFLVEKPCKITQKKANRETFSVKYSKNKQISTRGTLLNHSFFVSLHLIKLQNNDES